MTHDSRLAVALSITTPIALKAHFTITGFTALLGRSGAGKTTLIKALAGLIPAAGPPFEGIPPHQRRIGYLPQNAGLFPHLTALRNTAYALRGPTRLPTASALLHDLGLAHLANRAAPQLSGGEQQRVALARALASAPRLMLLDEPGAGLDAETSESTLTWLMKTLAIRGIPTLAATHDPAIANRADHIVLLADSKIIAEGTPAALHANPATEIAARLLGFENILTLNNQRYALRATDIAIHPTGLAAHITTIRPHGPALHITCTTPDPLTLITSHPPPTTPLIHLTWPDTALRPLAGDK